MSSRAFLFCCALLPAVCMADDWPQWRGPERNGHSAETGLLRKWPDGGPRLLWRIDDAGAGYSTPAVAEGRIYLLGNAEEKEFVQARNASDGKLLWQRVIGQVGANEDPKYPGARSTPTIDGERLYALGSDGDLACLNLEDGKILWTRDVRADFGGEPGAWAYSESPLVDGELVLCTPGGTDAAIVALKKETGEEVWRTSLPTADKAGYSSIVVSEAAGKRQYVQFLGKGLVGLDPANGKLLWQYGRTAEGSPANIPTPILDGDTIYSASGRGGGGLVRIQPGIESGLTTDELYHSPRLPSSIGGSVLVGEHLYGTNRQGLMCVTWETGEISWQDRSVGAASILFADGMLILHGEDREVALVRANPESYEELGRFSPPNPPEAGRDKSWAYPVLADGHLYIRDGVSMWCYDISE